MSVSPFQVSMTRRFDGASWVSQTGSDWRYIGSHKEYFISNRITATPSPLGNLVIFDAAVQSILKQVSENIPCLGTVFDNIKLYF